MTPLPSLSAAPLPASAPEPRPRAAERGAEAPRGFARALGSARGDAEARTDEATAAEDKPAPARPRRAGKADTDDSLPAGEPQATRTPGPGPEPVPAPEPAAVAATVRGLPGVATDGRGLPDTDDTAATAPGDDEPSLAAAAGLLTTTLPVADPRAAGAGGAPRRTATAEAAVPDRAAAAPGGAAASTGLGAAEAPLPGDASAGSEPPTPAAGPRPEPGGFATALAAATPATVQATAQAPASAPPAAEARLAQAPGSPGFAPELAARLSTFVRDGIEQARLHLNPAEMGPVEVRIALDGSAARVLMAAEQATTRQWLEQALPTLAAGLREAGLTLAGGGVFDRAPGGQAGQGDSPPPRPGTGSSGRAEADPLGATPAPGLAASRRRGVVDLVA